MDTEEPATGQYPEPEESSPYRSISSISILILSSDLRLCQPSCFMPSSFQTKILHAFLISTMRVQCPALIWSH
jgi:hypothetical protein